MKTVQNVLFLMLLILITAGCSKAEVLDKIILEKWGLSFEIPASSWINTPFWNEGNSVAHVVSFYRKAVVDSKGRKIIPVLGILATNVPEGADIVVFSGLMRATLPLHEIDAVFVKEDRLINLSNTIGYKLHYIDRSNIEHTVFLLHAINGTNGFQISIDATSEVFQQLESEFLKILKSISFVSNEY